MKIYNGGFHLKPGGTQLAEISSPLGTVYDYPQQHPESPLPMCVTWNFPTFNDQVGMALAKDALLVLDREPVPGLFAGHDMDDNLTSVQDVETSLNTCRALAASVQRKITLGSYGYPLITDGTTSDFDNPVNPITAVSTTGIRGVMRRIVSAVDLAVVVCYRWGAPETLQNWKDNATLKINQAVAEAWGKPIYAFVNQTILGDALGNGIANYPYISLADWEAMLVHIKDVGKDKVNCIIWDGYYYDDIGNWVWRPWADGESHFQIAERYHD